MVILRNFQHPGPNHPALVRPADPSPREEDQSLRAAVDAFLARHKMPTTRFGRLSERGSGFVDKLREGMKPQAATEQRVREFMRRYDAMPAGDWQPRKGFSRT